jgi:hypothetical protein
MEHFMCELMNHGWELLRWWQRINDANLTTTGATICAMRKMVNPLELDTLLAIEIDQTTEMVTWIWAQWCKLCQVLSFGMNG